MKIMIDGSGAAFHYVLLLIFMDLLVMLRKINKNTFASLNKFKLKDCFLKLF